LLLLLLLLAEIVS